jgi:hypothetical protein
MIIRWNTQLIKIAGSVKQMKKPTFNLAMSDRISLFFHKNKFRMINPLHS